MNPTNPMLLHALHVGSLTPVPEPMVPAMDLAMCASFGNVGQWREAFAAMAQARAGGSGWLLLSFLPRAGRLVNQWVADHTHAIAGGIPLLALDMDLHAHHPAVGAAAGASVDTFMHGIAWAQVYQRYQQAVAGASSGLGTTADHATGARLLDVRRAGVYAQADTLAAGAEWRDPALVDRWAEQLDAGTPVVVYCVLGHEVSRATAMRLRAAGVDARFLVGGLDGWRSQGRPLVAKPAA